MNNGERKREAGGRGVGKMESNKGTGNFQKRRGERWKEFVGVKGNLYTPIDREGVQVGQWSD